MTAPEVDPLVLGQRILDFLQSCGGAYKRITNEVEFNVFYALGCQQYVMKEKDGEIEYFASYWKVHPQDVEDVMNRIKPFDLSHGSVMYVSEAGNKGGKRAMAEIIKRLREQAAGMQGLFWHRPAKEDAVYYFPSQKGKEVAHG